MNTMIARAQFVSFGIPALFADLVEVDATIGDGHVAVSVGHDARGKRREVAIVCATGARVEEILTTREDAVAFMASAVRALPAVLRAQAPAWLLDNAEASRREAMRRRASGVATSAMQSRDADLPFAA